MLRKVLELGIIPCGKTSWSFHACATSTSCPFSGPFWRRNLLSFCHDDDLGGILPGMAIRISLENDSWDDCGFLFRSHESAQMAALEMGIEFWVDEGIWRISELACLQIDRFAALTLSTAKDSWRYAYHDLAGGVMAAFAV